MAATGTRAHSDDEIWWTLSQEIAHGADYDSAERHPISSCLPGTRTQVLDTLEGSLTHVDRKIVWLFGRAGTGKSSIAYSLADRLHKQDKLAVTFFFSQKHLGRSNADRVLLTIAYQLGLRHPRARARIIEAIRHDPTLLRLEASRREQFERLVADPLRSLKYAWGKGDRVMVFDAVQEIEASGKGAQVKELVLMLAELIRNSSESSPHSFPISSILFTSRSCPRLETLTKDPDLADSLTRHDLEDFDGVNDVNLYLQHTLEELRNNDDRLYRYPNPWPIERDLRMMARLMKGHFIVASTIHRLVRVADDPVRRLETITRFYRGDVGLGRAKGDIDSIYHYILSDCDLPTRRPAVECLADVISLAEPLTPMVLWELFGYDVRERMLHLSAVVIIPHSRSSLDPVQIYHGSLRDYVFNQRRSKEFYVDASESHQRLACMCFMVMQKDLEDSFERGPSSRRRTTSLPNFDDRRNTRVLASLRYACQYWPHHLERAKDDEKLRALVFDFFEHRRLSFVEFLSLVSGRDSALAVLQDARRILVGWSPSEERDCTLEALDSTIRLACLNVSGPENYRRYTHAVGKLRRHEIRSEIPVSDEISGTESVPDSAISVSGVQWDNASKHPTEGRSRTPPQVLPRCIDAEGNRFNVTCWESSTRTAERSETKDDSSLAFLYSWVLVSFFMIISYLFQ